MPLKNGKLTPQERDFVDALAASGDPHYALKKAKYRGGVNNLSQVMQRPAIQAAVVNLQIARLTNEALPLAVQTVVSVMKNEKAPAAARIQAAREVFNRVLPSEKGPEGKEPHEMTPEELAEAINRLETAAAAKARPVASVDVIEAETIEASRGDIFE